MLQMVAICPHPPIIIPEIGKEELKKVEKTAQAMEEIAKQIKQLDPEILVFITPHGAVFEDALTISHPRKLRGSFERFGSKLSMQKTFAEDLSNNLLKGARKIKPMVAELTDMDANNYGINLDLDHGILVPLYYLDKAGINVPILPINIGLLPYDQLYEFGIFMQEVIQQQKKRVVVIISGDMSHRLTHDAPAGFDPQGKIFDEIIVQAVSEGDVLRMFNIEPGLISKAGECGLRPIIIGLGILDGYEIKSKVYSYEGPFGVGYLVAGLQTGKSIESRKLLSQIRLDQQNKIKRVREDESWPVKWARENIEQYIKREEILPASLDIPEEFKGEKGVFVSIKKQGQLRGCIGTISATKNSIAEEIQANAIKAATEDPRFEPVDHDELEQLTYSVDILEKPERIDSINQLNPEIYGVIVRKGMRQGLLLPMLEGIDNAEEQVRIAKQKAGIGMNEKVELERFKVTRYY
ncbi:MAG: AmmeMemoRadiSam system protein A [Bacillota bacterium]